MKRLIFICAILLFFGSCTQGYKMPKRFEQDLREFYAKWYEERAEIFGPVPHLTTEQIIEVWKQDSTIRQKYGLLEQAKKLGYFTEKQNFDFDTANFDSSLYEKYIEGWIKRNATAEYYNFFHKKCRKGEILNNR